MSVRLRIVHVTRHPAEIPLVDARVGGRDDGERLIDIVFFPETCGWNPLSETPTLWQTFGTVQIPWRKTPKSIRRLFAKNGQAPKAITITPHGYVAPPPYEPVYVGGRHVVRSYALADNADTVRRFLSRAIRRLGRNRGTVTVFSSKLSDGQLMLGLTYSTGDNPFGGAPMPDGWAPFSRASTTEPTPQTSEPE